MALVREKDSKRLHIKSKLMGESLMRKTFMEGLEYAETMRMLPDASVMKIGGQSIIDTGSRSILPIIKEIAENAGEHKMIITTGGGTRSRHVYAIALELGMPTGIITTLGHAASEQNAIMISTLLTPYGGIKTSRSDLPELGSYLRQGWLPVMNGMPPYGYYEPPPEEGRLPANRTDVGTFLLAEVTGAKQCIMIKDVDGLFSDNPKNNPEVEFIPKIGAKELIERDLEDVVVERKMVELLCRTQNVKQVQIINGLKEGNISKALNGEHVGTIIYQD